MKLYDRARPRLLDLFCGAGGAAMGYWRAGFQPIGLDIVNQRRYPFPFVQGDALNPPFDLSRFAAIHASPVCYLWSKMRDCRPGSKVGQLDLITPMRPVLAASGVSWVMENVPGSPLRNWVRFCGSGFGLPLQRHRWFESNITLPGIPCAHGQNPWNPAYKHATNRRRRRVPVIGEWRVAQKLQNAAMGIDWMSLLELQEAVPPAYTEHIGGLLMEHLTRTAVP